MHWRGNEQLWSVQFHFLEFSAAFAPFEVLSPQDFECQRQKNLSAFQWLRHRSLFTNANFVLDMSSILISTWIGNLISKRWCLLEAHHTFCDPALMCQCGGNPVATLSFFYGSSLLIVDFYGSSLLIVIFPPDCNCWSWLSAVDCGDQWWERRKPARWERRATTTTAGGGFATDRGVWGQSFAKFPPRPMSGETRIEWICKFYWQSCV